MFHRALLFPLALLVTAGLAVTLAGGTVAQAGEAPVGLGTAASFGVLGASTVTNTGPTAISGNLGVSPGTAITGFPPGNVGNGTIHSADAVSLQAQSDVTNAYNDAAGRAPSVTLPGDIGGMTLAPGVYNSASSIGLTGTVTLDAHGDPNAVFVIQAGSTLISASSSNVALVNGASPCNVFWQVGSSATLGTYSTFRGTILALASITVTTGVTVDGHLLARNGAVTLDTNAISASVCGPPVVTTTTTAAPTTTTMPVCLPVASA